MMGSLGLVLSGGFLRGAFQVGVVEALHARGLRFRVVAGVSSGAWNAACIATGQIHEMREFWLAVARAPKLRWRNVWRYATPSNFPEIVRSVPMRRLYGPPVRIDGRYYVDGGFADNVPYETVLEAGCDRALAVVPDPRGRIWKRLMSRRPHEVPSTSRSRLVVIHPDAPLPIGRVRSTLDGVLRCIDAGHRAAEKALAECLDWESCAPGLAQTKEVEP